MKDIAKALITLALTAVFIFIAPWFVFKGWDAARELWPTLPEATYWQVFWITFAIQTLIKIGPSAQKRVE